MCGKLFSTLLLSAAPPERYIASLLAYTIHEEKDQPPENERKRDKCRSTAKPMIHVHQHLYMYTVCTRVICEKKSSETVLAGVNITLAILTFYQMLNKHAVLVR